MKNGWTHGDNFGSSGVRLSGDGTKLGVLSRLTMAIMIVAIIIQLFIYFSLVTQTFPIQLLEVL